MKRACLLLAALSFFAGCKDSSTEHEPAPEPSFSIEVEPKTGSVGDKIKITCSWSNLSEKPDLYYYYNDDLWTTYDSIAGNIIYAYIPFVSNCSDYKLNVKKYFNNTSLKASEVLHLRPLDNGIKIIKSDEPELTEEGAYLHYPKYTDGYKWQVEVNQDTVTLWRTLMEADDCSTSFYIKFLDKGEGVLPELIKCYKAAGCRPGSDNISLLKNGLIKIDKWKSGGIYSGIIYSELRPEMAVDDLPPVLRFWKKL